MTFNANMTIERDLSELGRVADQVRAWLGGVLDEDSAAGV
jgi:hypothetical protein